MADHQYQHIYSPFQSLHPYLKKKQENQKTVHSGDSLPSASGVGGERGGGGGDTNSVSAAFWRGSASTSAKLLNLITLFSGPTIPKMSPLRVYRAVI